VTEAHVEACAVAHGDEHAPADGGRTLVAVFAGPVARYLLHFAHDVGFHTVLVEPDAARRAGTDVVADHVVGGYAALADAADVVVADHHRPELGAVLRDALARPARWIGVIGSARHTAPHLEALRDLGVPAEEIARVHRPIGLNIGSRTPAEIALATLAGLIADRNGRPGGFAW
jgi:xanthine/CO dehydrogenase XdhC/CoxF family maturation factor